ncbi:hypothetical protein J6590_009917 [Homalodisca vitripennis]|nr:hypothetical protein J6590_009917 [Homalodisca vitripennis]
MKSIGPFIIRSELGFGIFHGNNGSCVNRILQTSTRPSTTLSLETLIVAWRLCDRPSSRLQLSLNHRTLGNWTKVKYVVTQHVGSHVNITETEQSAALHHSYNYTTEPWVTGQRVKYVVTQHAGSHLPSITVNKPNNHPTTPHNQHKKQHTPPKNKHTPPTHNNNQTTPTTPHNPTGQRVKYVVTQHAGSHVNITETEQSAALPSQLQLYNVFKYLFTSDSRPRPQRTRVTGQRVKYVVTQHAGPQKQTHTPHTVQHTTSLSTYLLRTETTTPANLGNWTIPRPSEHQPTPQPVTGQRVKYVVTQHAGSHVNITETEQSAALPSQLQLYNVFKYLFTSDSRPRPQRTLGNWTKG